MTSPCSGPGVKPRLDVPPPGEHNLVNSKISTRSDDFLNQVLLCVPLHTKLAAVGR